MLQHALLHIPLYYTTVNSLFQRFLELILFHLLRKKSLCFSYELSLLLNFNTFPPGVNYLKIKCNNKQLNQYLCL